MKEFDFEKMPIVEIVNDIIMDAVKRNVSDIHFDPSKENITVQIILDLETERYSFTTIKGDLY